MEARQAFFFDKAAQHDLVLARIIGAPRPQTLRAKLERVYSARKGVAGKAGDEVEFVQGGGTWGGGDQLAVGERALIFLTSISGRLYEDTSQGHLLVEEIEGAPYAIFEFRELWLCQDEDMPTLIKDNASQDPKRPYATAIRFEAMETYLVGLIQQIDRRTGVA